MSRPTIADVARVAQVSISTVDRVLNGRNPVRQGTAERVLAAAEQIGFHATGVIKQRLSSDLPKRRFGFLLQQGTRTFYRNLATALQEAATACADARVQAQVEFLDDLSPGAVAKHMRQLGSRVDGLAVVAAEHPHVADAIEQLHARGIPTTALISHLSAQCGVGYIGMDNWKVGRTAAWAIANLCKQPGKIGILLGSHRYRCQEMNEMGFRSYFRENAAGFQLLEPMTSFEDRGVAEELTRNLLRQHPDLAGLYISGGGIKGVLAALQEANTAGRVVAVGYELMDETRAGLIAGLLNLVISHPLSRLATETLETMVAATTDADLPSPSRIILPMELYTPENL